MGLFDKYKNKKELATKIHKLNKNIGGYNVVVYCDEVLSTQAEFILNIIAEEQEKKNILQNGYKIQIGWSIFFIIESEEGFVLHIPDFTKNPFTDMTDDISMVLLLQVEQNDILIQTKTQGTPVSFQDKMIILKDALYSDDLYFAREDTQKEGDSGWYLGLLKDDKKESRTPYDYVSAHTYQLLKFKPELLKLLALPVGCIVVIKDNAIFEIVDNNNNRIF